MQTPTVLSLASVVVTAGLAFADDNGAERLNVPPAQWLSVSEVTQKLAEPGNRVHEIEVQDGAYEFEASSSVAVKCKDHAHLATGEVVVPRFLCCRPCLAGRLNVPPAQWLSPSDLTQKLAAQGYRVHEIEVDQGAYEFEATSSAGLRIEGHAHPATGEVLPPGLLCCDSCLEI